MLVWGISYRTRDGHESHEQRWPTGVGVVVKMLPGIRCMLSVHALVSSAMCFRNLLFRRSRCSLSPWPVRGREPLVRASARFLAVVGDAESTATRSLVAKEGRGTKAYGIRERGEGGGGKGGGVDVAVWSLVAIEAACLLSGRGGIGLSRNENK